MASCHVSVFGPLGSDCGRFPFGKFRPAWGACTGQRCSIYYYFNCNFRVGFEIWVSRVHFWRCLNWKPWTPNHQDVGTATSYIYPMHTLVRSSFALCRGGGLLPLLRKQGTLVCVVFFRSGSAP